MEQILEYGTNYPAANGWKRLDLGGIYRLDRYVSPSGRAFNEGRHAATNHDLSEPYSDHAAQIRRQAGTYAPTNKIVNNCSWCYLGASHTMEAHIQAITRPC